MGYFYTKCLQCELLVLLSEVWFEIYPLYGMLQVLSNGLKHLFEFLVFRFGNFGII